MQTVHYTGHRTRLKEKFKKQGLQNAQDYEVLELLLTYALGRKDVKPLAKDLLARFKTFPAVLEAPIEELTQIEGVSEHTAILLQLTRECSDFYLKRKTDRRDVISSPEDLLSYCRSSMAGLADEQFRVLFLDSKNHIIHEDRSHTGTVNQTAVYPRKIMEQALKHKAVSLICVHNHPGGSPDPSEHDKRLTKALLQSAQTLGITIHDHIIIARDGYYSFREEGCI